MSLLPLPCVLTSTKTERVDSRNVSLKIIESWDDVALSKMEGIGKSVGCWIVSEQMEVFTILSTESEGQLVVDISVGAQNIQRAEQTLRK